MTLIIKLKSITIMKKMRKVAAIVIAMVAMTGLTSCSDEETHEGLSAQELATVAEPDDPNAAAIGEKLKAELLLSALCEVDSTSGRTVYTPHVGKALYSATPTVLYTVADTPTEAEATYQCIVSALQNESGSATVGHDVRQDDVHLTFTAGDGISESGRIVVDCPRLKDVMTALVFVPKAAWPENDVTSPIPFLSLVRHKGNGRIYLCVREPFGCDGILLTFDGGWVDDGFDSSWQGKFTMYKDCAKQEVFNCLGIALKTREDAMASMMQAVCDRIDGHNQTRRTLGKIYYGRETVLDYANKYNETPKVEFDCEYSYKKGRWWLRTNYYIDKKMATFTNRVYKGTTNHYEHKQKPTKTNPSSSIYFNMQLNVDQDYEFIYKPGASSKRRDRG